MKLTDILAEIGEGSKPFPFYLTRWTSNIEDLTRVSFNKFPETHTTKYVYTFETNKKIRIVVQITTAVVLLREMEWSRKMPVPSDYGFEHVAVADIDFHVKSEELEPYQATDEGEPLRTMATVAACVKDQLARYKKLVASNPAEMPAGCEEIKVLAYSPSAYDKFNDYDMRAATQRHKLYKAFIQKALGKPVKHIVSGPHILVWIG